MLTVFTVLTIIIDGMCKEKRLEEASEMFEKMQEMGLVPSAVTYNTLIDGYFNEGDLEKASGYWDEMVLRGILPTVSTYNLLVHALVMECKIGEAEALAKEMGEKGFVHDKIMYNILINGYCRSGNVKKAFSFLDEMLTKGIQPTREMDKLNAPPDDVTYNTLIQGHCREGRVAEAFYGLSVCCILFSHRTCGLSNAENDGRNFQTCEFSLYSKPSLLYMGPYVTWAMGFIDAKTLGAGVETRSEGRFLLRPHAEFSKVVCLLNKEQASRSHLQIMLDYIGSGC
ncbi:hypothetical protein CRYUN_Cryun06bG0014400 [Craigia yunnanensis]